MSSARNFGSRSRQRGAAMVEGAVVLPMLAMFFGVIMYVHNSYAKKQMTMSETRFIALSHAVHACTGTTIDMDPKPEMQPGEQRGVQAGSIPKEGDAPDVSKTDALNMTWLDTTANKTAVAVALGRSRTVGAKSASYCNPVIHTRIEPPQGPFAKFAGTSEKGMYRVLKFAGHAMQYVVPWGAGWLSKKQ